MKKLYTASLLLVMCLLTPLLAMAQLRESFPGAEGYGRYTTGGRGGKVYHVTTLEDNDEPGSFRYAVNQTGVRTIVFDVSGTIFLKSDLPLRNGNVTIAGQTAPGDGICIADRPFSIQANNVIIRFMRFRVGNRYVNAGGDDGADGLGALDKSDIIVDHCSVSWSIDECLSFSGTQNTTVQWCIVSQSLKNAGHSKGAHGYGGNWGGSGSSYHHNLIAHHDSRTPRLGPRPSTQLDERMDMRNNVIYNFGGNGCYGGEGMNVNIVNNYYKPGAATKSNTYQTRIAGLGIRTLEYCFDEKNSVALYNKAMGTNVTSASVSTNSSRSLIRIDGKSYEIDFKTNTYDVNGTKVALALNSYGPALHLVGTYYVNGNANSKYPSLAQNNWDNGIYNQIDNSKNDYIFTAQTLQDMRLDTPIEFLYTTTHTAEDAYSRVLDYAGASLKRDALDNIIISDTRNGKCTFGTNGIIDNQDQVYYGSSNNLSSASSDRWPELKSTAAPKDSDGDGMPDEWEKANGLDSENPNDGAIVTKDGYTNLEHYINSLVEEIMTKGNEGGKMLTGNLEITDPAVELPEYDPNYAPETPETATWDISSKTISNPENGKWEFENGIIVTCSNSGRGYSAGSKQTADFVKFGRNETYTITIPDGYVITGVKLKGYANDDNKDGTVNIDGTDYTLVTRTEAAPSEYDIELATPKNPLVMTIGSACQMVFMVTLNVTKPTETGIQDIISDTDEGDGKIYNLMGVEVKGNPAPGIYIRNGKKFLVK